MEGIFRKKGGARKLLTKEKKRIIFGLEQLFQGEHEGFLPCTLCLLSMGNKEGPCDRLCHWLLPGNSRLVD